MPCLEPSVVQSLALGKLPADGGRAAEAHLRECATCRASVAKATLAADALTHLDDTALPTVDIRGPSLSIEPGSRIGSFEVLERLGEGGMGTVYTAYHPELDRKVALKLIRAGGVQTKERQARLLREAIAMARLSHPNVVAIHDVGSHEDKVFLVMERVEGETLKVWLEEGARPWREVLRVFQEAGRGLAAAHAAGMVHRDFKPGNVIVSRDGRVRVTDFGLARAISDERNPVKTENARTEASAVALSEVVTRTGHTPGTVSYMAPELLFGRPADTRTDQYAFCVSLWEALYGERPVLKLLPDGPRLLGIDPAPKTAQVPAWVRKIVERGLSVDPARRFPSIEALLTALGNDPAVRRRKAYTAGGVVLLLLAVAGGARLWVSRQSQLCAGAPRRLAGVWDVAVAERVRQRLFDSKLPYVPATWDRVHARLDEHARAWSAAFRDACAATRVRGEQSEQIMDLRMQCLDADLNAVAALATVLSRADNKIAENAVTATDALPDPSQCSDVAALRGATPPPADPAVRTQISQAEQQLAQASILWSAGKLTEARRALDALMPGAEALAYAPLTARTYQLLAHLEESKGGTSTLVSNAAYQRAFDEAQAAHLDELAVQCLLDLAQGYSRDHARSDQARELAEVAHGITRRVRDPTRLSAKWRSTMAEIAWGQGKLDEGIAHEREALRLLEGLDVPLPVADKETKLGWALMDKGDLAGAHDVLVRAYTLREAELGPDHPALLQSLSALAREASIAGRPEEAVGYLRRALALSDRVFGTTETPRRCVLQNNVASTLVNQGTHPDEALHETQVAFALCHKVLSPDNPQLPFARILLGTALREAGHPREAAREHLGAQTDLERLPSTPPAMSCQAPLELAFDDLADGRPGEALVVARRGLKCVSDRKVDGLLSNAYEALGEATLATGDDAGAVVLATRELEILTAEKRDELVIADANFLLARARWRTQPALALSLAEQARRIFEARGTAPRLQRFRAWRAEHR